MNKIKKFLLSDTPGALGFKIVAGTVLILPTLYILLSLVIYGNITGPEVYGVASLLSPTILLFTIVFIIVYIPRYLNKYDIHREMRNALTQKEAVEKEINSRILAFITNNLSVSEVEKAVYQQVLSDVETELFKRLDNKYSDIAKRNYEQQQVDYHLQPLENNTNFYLSKLQRNSVVNLMIGIVGSIAAISILIFTIFPSIQHKSATEFAYYFVPRFTFALFIQLFAYFFLRLYKNNLEDSKYFQNELTNISSKAAAIRIAQMLGRADKVDELLKDLAQVERNFKLGKDESVVSLENKKIEKEVDAETLNKLVEILKLSKKDV